MLKEEKIAALAKQARVKIYELGITNVEIKIGDGKRGWPEHAPYRGIVVAADAAEIPPALVEQLAEGGRIVLPIVGEMTRGTKIKGKMKWENFGLFSFVPLV